MTREYVPIDITNAPELARVAEAVRRSGKPHALKRGAETVAVVRPAPSPAGAPRKTSRHRGAATLTPAEREEILRATSGGWKGLIDPDQLKADLNELQRDEATPRSL